MLRKLLQDLAPPLLLRIFRGLRGGDISFRGDFDTWEAAVAASTGYDSDAILRATREAALKVKQGEARFDRDGVAFDRVEFQFPANAALLRAAAARSGELTVLDFGGSLGTSYRQFRAFGAPLRRLRWNVVEQPRIAATGSEHFESTELRFFSSLAEALRDGKPDVVLLSSVLQYLPDPYAVLEELAAMQPASMVIDRTPCSEGSRDLLCVQTVPASIYQGSYPCWVFSRVKLESALGKRHVLRASFRDSGPALHNDLGEFVLQGYVLDAKA